jgi:hypothetical protein
MAAVRIKRFIGLFLLEKGNDSQPHRPLIWIKKPERHVAVQIRQLVEFAPPASQPAAPMRFSDAGRTQHSGQRANASAAMHEAQSATNGCQDFVICEMGHTRS